MVAVKTVEVKNRQLDFMSVLMRDASETSGGMSTDEFRSLEAKAALYVALAPAWDGATMCGARRRGATCRWR